MLDIETSGDADISNGKMEEIVWICILSFDTNGYQEVYKEKFCPRSECTGMATWLHKLSKSKLSDFSEF